MTAQNKWLARVEEDPNHSSWYIERFRTMAAEGRDLAGEARFIDTLAARKSHILDAGCGPGRVGAVLADAGHTVVGVDIDPALIEAARVDHPGPTWLTADLAELDLAAHGIDARFDIVVCAGNVMTFLAEDTRVAVLQRLRAHLADDGRIAIGFGANRDYEFAAFRADAATAGLTMDLELSTWDVRPMTDDADFLVAILTK